MTTEQIKHTRCQQPATDNLPQKIKAAAYAEVSGLDGELLRCGDHELGRALIAARHGLTITQARIKWRRLVKECAG